jgi:hypothetical protein
LDENYTTNSTKTTNALKIWGYSPLNQLDALPRSEGGITATFDSTAVTFGAGNRCPRYIPTMSDISSGMDTSQHNKQPRDVGGHICRGSLHAKKEPHIKSESVTTDPHTPRFVLHPNDEPGLKHKLVTSQEGNITGGSEPYYKVETGMDMDGKSSKLGNNVDIAHGIGERTSPQTPARNSPHPKIADAEHHSLDDGESCPRTTTKDVFEKESVATAILGAGTQFGDGYTSSPKRELEAISLLLPETAGVAQGEPSDGNQSGSPANRGGKSNEAGYGSGSSPVSNGQLSSSPYYSSGQKGRKRPLGAGGSGGDGDEDDEQHPSNKKLCDEIGDPIPSPFSGKRLACPFWLNDPLRYRTTSVGISHVDDTYQTCAFGAGFRDIKSLK